jgi:threonine 3-dehydrogenase
MYNIAAFSPRADEIAASVRRVIPDAKFTYVADPARQGILDSWPKAIDDSAARRDWNWKPTYDLDAMTDDLLPRVRRMLDLGAVLSHG